jgi:membrane-associated phospholipid phosphatase
MVFPLIGLCQQKDTLIKKLDSMSKVQADTSKNGNNDISQENYNEVTRMTGRTYLLLTLSNFKQQFTAPFHIKTKDYRKLLAFGLLEGGLIFADKSINNFTLELTKNNPAVAEISKYVTQLGGKYEVVTLAGLAAYGFIFKNEKIKTTTLLASQAYMCATIFEGLKFISGRQRPNYYEPETGESHPTWHGPLYQFKKINGEKPNVNSYTSFPSGHTMVAFAAATVYAMEYRDRPLVPIISYSVASLIGLSRLTENRHWASDVFGGATLGYLCGRLVVNNYHRYNRLQKEKRSITFNASQVNGRWVPGAVYHF